ncbi:uncharacterized protein PFLUO_LOCUS2270 [Penicillium psychrofluorescens]|uniref:uncharacterized protein n=1 Tax=Penicillium psychrofluorescens TaxID=3158075 RepID=UPI003CCDD1D0
MDTLAAAETPLVSAMNLFSLQGKHALVTGGSRGIGAAMAHALADAGCSVCIAQHDVTNTTVADAIRAKGVRAELLQCNLSNMDEARGLFPKALEVMGGQIDILINCAGTLHRKPSVDVTEQEWDSVVDVNLKALFLVCQGAGRHMIPRRSGKIVNVSSLNSFIGGEIVASYAASKGAVSQLTKSLSNEWARYNIQVNAIAPGSIATDM